MFRISKIPIFESNSQHVIWEEIKNPDVPNLKDTNFRKQFTTHQAGGCILFRMFRISKIPIFESNSQHENNPDSVFKDVPNLKDTNFRKQFTTGYFIYVFDDVMFRISKIPIFESNSQLGCNGSHTECGCSESQRYQFSKAIHNDDANVSCIFVDVPNLKDTNFRKQFTTIRSLNFIPRRMFRISKIPIFESNSQQVWVFRA